MMPEDIKKLAQEYEICKRIISEKDDEITHIEKENSILESQLIIANEEIERLKGLLESRVRHECYWSCVDKGYTMDEAAIQEEKEWKEFKTKNNL